MRREKLEHLVTTGMIEENSAGKKQREKRLDVLKKIMVQSRKNDKSTESDDG